MGNAYKAFIHHQSRQDNRYSRGYRYGRQFLQPGGQSGQGNGGGRKDADRYRGGNANAYIPIDVEVTDIVHGTNSKIWIVKCNKCSKWGHAGGHCS
eukprot:13908399-Ditylum_brightwellii.AAC.1